MVSAGSCPEELVFSGKLGDAADIAAQWTFGCPLWSETVFEVTYTMINETADACFAEGECTVRSRPLCGVSEELCPAPYPTCPNNSSAVSKISPVLQVPPLLLFHLSDSPCDIIPSSNGDCDQLREAVSTVSEQTCSPMRRQTR